MEEMATPLKDPAAAAEAEQAKAQLEAARPHISLLHHMAAVQGMVSFGFTVTLLDGSEYRADAVDHIFTDGLTVVTEGRRRYFPLTAIRDILIHNPGER
jgi:hypothetical protein